MPSPDHLYWPALAKLPLGPIKLKRAMDKLGSPQAVWKSPLNELQKIEGIGALTLEEIQHVRQTVHPEQEYEQLQKSGCQFFTFFDSDYPNYLKQIYDPPLILFYKGHPPKKETKALAIVGTRRATRYGKTITDKLATPLAKAGFTIVSGLARGIDTQAHRSALATNGQTWAVLGCGLDTVYPWENKTLFEQICETGAVLSEYPLGTPPLAVNFPGRNRIITGLSQGTIIVQCSQKSGAMISARYALEQNREVFAVPGNVDLPQSAGPNLLIKQGAKLVENAEDVLEEFAIAYAPKITAQAEIELTPIEKQITDQLTTDPLSFDLLVNQCGLPLSRLSEQLLVLELKDVIKQLPGKYYVRNV